MNELNSVIFLNGKLPCRKIIEHYIDKNSYIVCADGGANKVRKYRILPKIILGDLDSINNETKKYFTKKNIEIRKIEDQDTTDFEKSLLYCIENDLRKCLIFGAISSRSDHTLNNFSILKKYYKSLDLKIIDNRYEIFFINNNVSFDYRNNKTLSIMAMPYAKGITTNGLKYPLNNEDLEFGVREGTLNESVSDKITIQLSGGDLLLFKKHFL
jgi:thiamine pyrophosphokinase